MAELAYAVGSNPTERIGLKSRVHVGSNPTAGTILRGYERAMVPRGVVSAEIGGFESRVPRQDGLVPMRREGTATLEVP